MVGLVERANSELPILDTSWHAASRFGVWPLSEFERMVQAVRDEVIQCPRGC